MISEKFNKILNRNKIEVLIKMRRQHFRNIHFSTLNHLVLKFFCNQPKQK